MILVSPSWLKVSRTWIGTTALPDPIFVCDLVWSGTRFYSLLGGLRYAYVLAQGEKKRKRLVMHVASSEIGISVRVAIE